MDTYDDVDTPTADGGEQEPLPPHRKRHQRHLLACVGCRKIKTRCLGNEDQVSACQRCQRLKLECVYARKRRRKLTSEPAPSVPAPTYTYRTPNPIRPQPPQSENSTASSMSHVATPNRVDIREYLDPQLPRDVNEEVVGLQRQDSVYSGDDPITLQLVTIHEAETLHVLYMQHLHPLIATLDPKLHTIPFLRTSPLLLSALLTVSAKYFLQRQYSALLSHTRGAVNRAVGEGQCDIGLIQALILMITWKDTNDGSSWVKLGIAIRLGYQLGMHIRRTDCLPADQHKARRVVDIERTWYTLSSFDRLYSDVYSLPPTVRLEEIPDAMEWAKETAYLNCGDFRHACSFSSASTYRMWVQYRRNLRSMSRDLAWVILSDLYGQMDEHMKRWFPRDPAFGKITPFEQTYLKWFDLNHLTKIKYHMIDNCPTSECEANILDWLTLSEEFTKQTEALGRLGTLRFLQDTSATHISSYGVMVYNLFSRLPSSHKRLAIEYVRRLSNCCESATSGDGETVMGFVGRFMRRLKVVLETAEREASRPAPPPPPPAPAPAMAAPYRVQVAPPVPLTLSLPSTSHTIPTGPLPTTSTSINNTNTNNTANPALLMPQPPDPIGTQLDLDDFFRSLLQNGAEGCEGGATSAHGWWFDPNVVL